MLAVIHMLNTCLSYMHSTCWGYQYRSLFFGPNPCIEMLVRNVLYPLCISLQGNFRCCLIFCYFLEEYFAFRFYGTDVFVCCSILLFLYSSNDKSVARYVVSTSKRALGT